MPPVERPPVVAWEVLSAVAELLGHCRAMRLPEPFLHAMEGGGLQVEWRDERFVAEAEFRNDGGATWSVTAPPWSADVPAGSDVTGAPMADVAALVAAEYRLRRL